MAQRASGYRLSRLALADLDGIYAYTCEHWSPQQAQRYYAELIASLVTWGAAHFEGLDPEVLQEAAKMVAEDRRQMRKQRVNPPGGAEYLDLVRAVVRRHPRSIPAQKKLLSEIRNFVLRKHPDTEA